MNDDLWSRVILTEGMLRQHEQEQAAAKDVSWLGPYIANFFEDEVFRSDLRPTCLDEPTLVHIWCTIHQLSFSEAFRQIAAGTLKWAEDGFITTTTKVKQQLGVATFGFHMKDMTQAFRFYRHSIVEGDFALAAATFRDVGSNIATEFVRKHGATTFSMTEDGIGLYLD